MIIPGRKGSTKFGNLAVDVRHDQCLAPLDQLAGRGHPLHHVVAKPDQLVEIRVAVAAEDQELVAVELLDAGALVRNNLAQLGQDQIENVGHAQRAAERMGCGAECLGLFPSGALGVEQAGVLDRDRRVGGECGRHVCELFVVDVGHEVVDAEDADNAVADDHRRTDPTANACTAADVTREMRVVGDVGENLRPLRPHDMAVEIGLVVKVETLPEDSLQIVEAATAHESRGGCPAITCTEQLS